MNCELCEARNITHHFTIRQRVSNKTLTICCICIKMFGMDSSPKSRRSAREHCKRVKAGEYPTPELEAALAANRETGQWPENIAEIIKRADARPN